MPNDEQELDINNTTYTWRQTFRFLFFKTKLEDISPFCGATVTPNLDFWCFMTCMKWIPLIHLCGQVGNGQYSSWAFLIQVLAYMNISIGGTRIWDLVCGTVCADTLPNEPYQLDHLADSSHRDLIKIEGQRMIFSLMIFTQIVIIFQ